MPERRGCLSTHLDWRKERKWRDKKGEMDGYGAQFTVGVGASE